MSTTYAPKQAPAQKATISNAAVVDDRRTLPVAQRVIQRTGGVVQRAPADGVFKFYPDISGDDCKNRVPYEPGKIYFTPYKGGEVRSAGFNGCYMMAFKFVEGKMRSDKKSHLIFDTSVPMSNDFNATYIAHVANDTAREALFDVENRGLVQIERIFRPYRSDVRDVPILDWLSLSLGNKIANAVGNPKIQAGLNRLTGGMRINAGGAWVSYVYNQEKFFKNVPNVEKTNFEWRNGNAIRYSDAQALKYESIATKICLYASVAQTTRRPEIRNKAFVKLNYLIERYPELAQYAKSFHFSTTNPAKDLITI